jgi:hypothetical protein
MRREEEAQSTSQGLKQVCLPQIANNTATVKVTPGLAAAIRLIWATIVLHFYYLQQQSYATMWLHCPGTSMNSAKLNL